MWGGNKLKTVLHKDYNEENIGESWEISDVKGDETIVTKGALAGYTLKTLAQEFGAGFLGNSVYEKFGDDFPLLIKFIDAETPLSIQVHPHDEVAKTRHNSFGKNEMWYIMDADKDAEIIVGFRKTTDKRSYIEALEHGNILDLLNTVNTQKGDTFYIPTGRVHAIGAGVLLAEIQQTSDVTYRIYDYNRVDKATGKTRELHNDLAIDVIDFEAHDSYKTEYEKTPDTNNKLVHSPYFKTNILFIEKGLERDYTKIDSFVILICVNGNASVVADEKDFNLKKGQTILLPAVISGINILPISNAEIIEVFY
jgi:mannose-6-phosphate isomerase